MSGSDIAGKLAPTAGAADDMIGVRKAETERLAWPAAALLVLLLSGGLWLAIGLVASHLIR